MPALTIDLPDAITEADARLYLAMKLLEVGQMSSGQAAGLAGYSKRTFLELISKHGLPVFNYSPAELADDLCHV